MDSTRPRCASITPFGRPVAPEVYGTAKMSSSFTCTGHGPELDFASSDSYSAPSTMKRSTQAGAAARAAASSSGATKSTRARESSQMNLISGGGAAGPMVDTASPALDRPQTSSMYSSRFGDRMEANSP